MDSPSAGCCDLFEAEHVRPNTGRTLIVGSQVYSEKPDRRKLYKDVLGVDMLAGPGVDRVLNLEEILPSDLGQFAHVECMSVLEHSRRPWLMAANIERLLEPGGTIYITVPLCWRVHAYPDDYWRMTPSALQSIFPGVEWEKLALGYGDQVREPNSRIRALKRRGIPYFPRTETLAFGRRQ